MALAQEILTRRRCYSHEINETLPVNFGAGVEWKMRDGSKLITVLKKPRTVYGEVSTFKGWSFGAIRSEFQRIFGEGWVLNEEDLE